jgi:hypothetical protein
MGRDIAQFIDALSEEPLGSFLLILGFTVASCALPPHSVGVSFAILITLGLACRLTPTRSLSGLSAMVWRNPAPFIVFLIPIGAMVFQAGPDAIGMAQFLLALQCLGMLIATLVLRFRNRLRGEE